MTASSVFVLVVGRGETEEADVGFVSLPQHAVAISFVSAAYIDNIFGSAALVFTVVLALFSVNETASELEAPFGSDINDLPLAALEAEFCNEMATLGGQNWTAVDALAADGIMYNDAEINLLAVSNTDLSHLQDAMTVGWCSKPEKQECVTSDSVGPPLSISTLIAQGGFGRVR